MVEIRRRGHFTRFEPSSILIQTRRLLEDTNLQKTFPVVVLYADWCAHPRLDRIGAGAVLWLRPPLSSLVLSSVERPDL